MRIAFIVPGFSGDENDWCIPAHTDIVRTLATEHDVHVFALRYPHRTDAYRIGDATVHSFGGATVRGFETARLWQRVRKAIVREHSRQRFDVLHAIFGGEAGLLTVLTAKQLRVPSAVWLVNGELVGLRDTGYGADLNPRLRWMNQFILRYADAVLCGCDALTEQAHARMSPRRREVAFTLPLGVNTTRFALAPRTSASSTAEFLNVGSLVPVKAQNVLLHAFARIIEKIPAAHLTIAGTGPLEFGLRTLTKDLGIETHVTFAGNVAHDQLPPLYQSANVFVQTSLHEGQGMALLEAAACGCAVCGTDVGVLHDLARRDFAIAFAPGDTAAAAKAMRQTFLERETRAVQVMQFVQHEYNLEHISNRLNALYARLTCKESLEQHSTSSRARHNHF